MSEMRFWYPASITEITSINESFDSCLLRVCYAGKNRNRSIISKESIERATPTMAYCPIVAHYDVEKDTIGGHDVGFMEDGDGNLKMINLTDAVGVIPENPQWCWESVTEEDGTEREYLCTPAILWKRTPCYDKLKRDGVEGQSMEIRVKDGKIVDGDYVIDSFDFTAFCLLGEDVEPCFESASVELFAKDELKARFGEMMSDFKRSFSDVMTAEADDIKTDFCSKGGEVSLKIDELMSKYGLTAEDITFDTDGMSEEELEAKFAEIRDAKFADDDAEAGDEANDAADGDSDGDPADSDAGADETDDGDKPEEDDDEEALAAKKQYSLTGEQLSSGIREALCTEKITDEWGEFSRYGYVDYDAQISEVYAYDWTDCNLYGFKFSMNGDNVIIDFASKKRKKFAFVDFDEGEQMFDYSAMSDFANRKFGAMADEVNTLREYKKSVEDAERNAALEELFAKFADLNDNEAFNALRGNCEDMSLEDIEDKCFAIRGRSVQVKFSQDAPKPVRLPVERNKNKDADEPYGGVFLEFGIGNRK